MSELHLDSLEIKNFRCFEHLVVEKLGRVNLIVGKNSVGKTALLEAIRLFSSRGASDTLLEILGYRNESDYAILASSSKRVDLLEPQELNEPVIDSAIRYLFAGRNNDLGRTFSIGSLFLEKQRLSLGLELYVEEQYELGKRLVGPISPEQYKQYDDLIPRIAVYIGEEYRSSLPLSFNKKRSFLGRRSDSDDLIACQFIPVNGLDARSIAIYWERVSLTQDESDIVYNLTKVVPDITGVNLVGFSERLPSGPFVIAKIKDQPPIPLRSLGDGLYRAFGITLALVNSRNGFLLIDEFETGLHHSVQTEIWRMILQTAKRLNVQVFATTHSWDCVEAFQEASSENEDEEAILIRLQRKRDGSGVIATLYDKESMDVVTRQGIEVR